MIIFIITSLILTTQLTYTQANYVGGSINQEISPPVMYQDKPEIEVYNEPVTMDRNTKMEVDHLSDLLVSILREDWGGEGLPLLYLEEEPSTMEVIPELTSRPWKRTRYYRRYPWKRQNSRFRTRYDDPDNPHMCQPTRDEVFKLLVALHETRAGNGGRSINFCHRRRSVGTIFTNIRFLGRRK